jgi:hypothetical protein
MQYYTHLNPLFNINPEEGKSNAYGWKTINGFQNEAKKLASCLIQNERLQNKKYTWHITINTNGILTDDGHKRVWKQASRILRQHLTAFYIREPDTDNHVNYHLIINTEISERRLRECLKSAFQQQAITYGIAPIKSSFGLARYITKADERYRDKRLLSAKYCRLNKHGTIGQFWHQSIKTIWDNTIKTERRISATITEHYAITQAAKYLRWATDGWYPFRRIRRRLAEQYPHNGSIVSDLASRYESEYSVS